MVESKFSVSRKGILFVISGPSGVGKGTLTEMIVEQNHLQYSISATTRPPRVGEVQGKDYFFLERSDFEAMMAGDEFLEWAEVYGNYYGTPRRFVLDNLERGQDVLLEIDIQGAMQVKAKFPEGVFIFIAPPSEAELAQRLEKRGKDSSETIANRLLCYDKEMAQMANYDYVVVNDELESTMAQLIAIITAERCRVVRFIGGDDTYDDTTFN